MNYCAIISEFNPFTNGHKYIINQAKAKTGLDIICLMSGNFVERGEIAILDKYERATTAIKNGASIVLELPLIYALASAEVFASGAIKVLKQIPAVSHIAFGVELNDTAGLEKLARVKAKETLELKLKLKQEIKKGVSYNKAMVNALKYTYPELKNTIDEVFNSSNNILALEYLTAIYKQKANITPVYILRTDKGYNSKEKVKQTIDNKKVCFAPASYIREMVFNCKAEKVKELVPIETYEFLSNYDKQFYKTKKDKLEAIIITELRKKNSSDLFGYYDYNQSLANLIEKNSKTQKSLNDIISSSTSKSIRESRIKKLLLYPTLGITKEKFNQIDNKKLSINTLATNEENKKDLAKIKKNSKLDIIISNSDYLSCENKELLNLNELSSLIYLTVSSKEFKKDKTIFIKTKKGE